MKRIAAALMVAGLGMFAGAGVADAYPPGSGTAGVDNANPGPGEDFSLTISNCLAGEELQTTFNGATTTSTCTLFSAAATTPPASGSAVITLTAPTVPGTYPGTVLLVTSDVTLSFSVTVPGAVATTAPATTAAPAPVLPATGSSGTNSTLWIAGLLLVFGAGMFGVAHARRQQTPVA